MIKMCFFVCFWQTENAPLMGEAEWTDCDLKWKDLSLSSAVASLLSSVGWFQHTYLFLDPDQKRKKNYKRKKKQTTNLICLEVLCRYHPHYLSTLLCMTQSLFLFSCCMFDLSWMTISSDVGNSLSRGGHENWLYYSIFKYHFLELKPL